MSYQIADEPVESSLRDYAVHPHAPMLAMMVCGAWLAWPWFAFNAFAIGSPTRRTELALCGATFGATFALAGVVLVLFRHGVIPDGVPLRLALLAITTCKLALGYWLVAVQERTFHVYAYYGGRVRDARRVLAVGWLIRGFVIGLVDHPLWVIVVSGGLGSP